MNKAQLMEKYAGEIPYDDLMERFINLYIENRKLKAKLDEIIKLIGK